MFKMYDLDMNEIEYPEGFIPLDIFISSIEKKRNVTELEGSNVVIDNGFNYLTREIEIDFLLKSHDTQDYRLIRDETFRMFGRFNTFYLVEEYQKGKRYLVSVDEPFIPERLPTNQRHARCKVKCKKIGLPFAESVGTSLNITTNGLNSEEELWGFGMGLESVDETLIYSGMATVGNSFRIFNPGIEVHPFEQDLKIGFNYVVGSDEMFQVTNLSNGSRFRVDKPVNVLDRLIYDGPNVTINDLSVFRDTRRDFIYLSPGWNTFQIYHCDSAFFAFDFRFYYD